MTPELKSLCDRLEAWAPLVGSGYDVPAAAETILEAAAKLREMAGALEFYVVICGNTAYSVDREAAMHAYDKARAALGGSHG